MKKPCKNPKCCYTAEVKHTGPYANADLNLKLTTHILTECPQVKPFVNPEVEHTTREHAYEQKYGASQYAPDEGELMRQGYEVAWRDITLEGCFSVYRRSRKATP